MQMKLELKKKMVLQLLLMILTAAVFFGGSFAYFTDDLYSNTATFTSGNLKLTILRDTVTATGDGSIRIQPGMKVVGSVFAENTGDLPAFVRIKVEKKITLGEKNKGREAEINEALISFDINAAYWTLRDGYYYYSLPLESGERTQALFTTVTFDPSMDNLYREGVFDIEMEIEGVQANGNGQSATDALGWPTEVADED